jgi:hypothetical protein
MDSLEEIGALLGFVAFAGLAVLVFLTFQQARHIRRLRDWAGRAPERAAAQAAREVGVDEPAAERAPDDDVSSEEFEAQQVAAPSGESRWVHLREDMAVRWEDWDRRSPVDPKIIVGGLLAIVIGLLIATGGFGLVGGDDGGSTSGKEASSGKGSEGGSGGGEGSSSEDTLEVAVLNGTAPPGGTGVPGVADRVSGDVEDAGFTVGEVDNAGSFAASVVMFTGDAQADAEDLAGSLETLLGPTEVIEMTPEIEALAGKADIALVIGQDDSGV